MSLIHEIRRFSDAHYLIETSAQQAIIDEIRGLRQDLYNTGGEVSDQLAYAILRLVEHLERS